MSEDAKPIFLKLVIDQEDITLYEEDEILLLIPHDCPCAWDAIGQAALRRFVKP